MLQGVFFRACVGAIPTLDALGPVYFDAVCPQLSINFGGRMGFINELCGTIATTGAFIEVNVPGFFPDLNFQIPLFPFNAFDGGAGMNPDVDMPADLDQFRRYDSHGAIIGGECLIQLRHGPPNGRAFLYEVNKKTRICQIQCGLHTGNPSAHNHYGPPYFFRHAALLQEL